MKKIEGHDVKIFTDNIEENAWSRYIQLQSIIIMKLTRQTRLFECTFAKINIDMLENFRQRIASVFDVPDQEQHTSIKLGRILLWFAIAGIIGGFSPFILPTNHGLLVSSLISALFIILTAKPILNGL